MSTSALFRICVENELIERVALFSDGYESFVRDRFMPLVVRLSEQNTGYWDSDSEIAERLADSMRAASLELFDRDCTCRLTQGHEPSMNHEYTIHVVERKIYY